MITGELNEKYDDYEKQKYIYIYMTKIIIKGDGEIIKQMKRF